MEALQISWIIFILNCPQGLNFCDFFKYINLHCPTRPTPSSLAALHRPESCKVQRRLNGWYGGGGGGGGVGGGGGDVDVVIMPGLW